MRADRVEVTWDGSKSSGLVRITNGEEVIRRHCHLPRDSDDQTIRSVVQKTVEDEGYEPDPTSISIHRGENGQSRRSVAFMAKKRVFLDECCGEDDLKDCFPAKTHVYTAKDFGVSGKKTPK